MSPADRRPAGRAGGRRRAVVAGAVLLLVAGLAVALIARGGGEDGADGERAGAPPPNELVPPASESTPEPAPAPDAEAPVDRLALRQRVGQLLVLRFDGTSPPAYVREVLRERRAAGVILFRDNVAAPGQTAALTRALRRAGGRPLVAVDQEGGEIRIVPWAPPTASQAEQAAARRTTADARSAARALRRLGITVSLAPVADVPTVAGAALAGRAFAADPRAASAAVAGAVRGWRAGGVAATVKHFPGLGGARVNTDDGPATVDRSRAQLTGGDLVPFAAAVDAGVPLVMVGHARYPALDRGRIASQSRPIIEGLLRERLGFRGVVVTDSMEAAASADTGAITTAAERAVRAGADLLLLTGKGSYAPVYQHLLAVARRSPGFRARVRESAARVLRLKAAAAR